MSKKTFNAEVSKGGKEVRLYTRFWDGIDHPEYDDVEHFHPDEARFLAQQLFAAAEKIDGKSKRDRTAARIRSNTEAIMRQAKKEAMA